MNPDTQTLNTQFAQPGRVDFDTGPGELPYASLSNPRGDRAEVYLHGGHVANYTPAGAKPILWVGSKSWFHPELPIRGGVPICFPWFGPKDGDPDAPGHGFARLMRWDVESVDADESAPAVTLLLRSDEQTKAHWPFDFELRLTARLSDALQIDLQTRNTGAEPFTITEALHSYFVVSDVRKISIGGLEGCSFFDKADGGTVKKQDGPITFASETDRVYMDTQSECILDDPGLGRKIRIGKSGSDSTVVWNPWTQKAHRMEDFDDQEWTGMVCIETANALNNAVTIAPGAEHTLTARIALVP